MRASPSASAPSPSARRRAWHQHASRAPVRSVRRPSIASNGSSIPDIVLKHGASGTGFGAGLGPSSKVQLAILGDLHLAPEQMHLFHDARAQMRSHLCDARTGQALPGSRVVQLGDLGHGKHRSGSASCFEYARDFLSGFGTPYALVLGNHDLEGEEFETDEDNLAAWHHVWGQPHYWAADLGPFVAIGLSTTRYRSNDYSHHEVHVDEQQMRWFEQTLETLAQQQRQVVVFTHAPPQGCGLKVIQEVHVKNRCAWLCHSDRPERFIQLVQRYPNIRLWFSGHFHLSQNYSDSISVVGSCAFVQTGVIGACNRDGHRQSRLLSADSQGFRVFTIDHGPESDVPTAHPPGGQGLEAAGEAPAPAPSSGRASPWPPLRLDLVHRWDDLSSPSVVTPGEALLTPAGGGPAGWLRSEVECTVGSKEGARVTRKSAQPAQWFPVGGRTILALQSGLLVEYDIGSCAPVGLVCKVPRGCEVALRTADGGEPQSADGSDVDVVEVLDLVAGGSSKFKRSAWGFSQVFQPNKWKLKQQRIAEERASAAAKAASGPQATVQAGTV